MNARISMAAGLVMTCSVVLAPIADAAGIAGAAEAAAARRAAKQASGASKAAAERAAFRRVVVEMDENIVTGINKRFGPHLLETTKDLPPPKILTREQFDLHLQRRYPDMTPERRQALLGYTSDGKVVVNMNHQEGVLTLAHERLHQFSHPRFHEQVGRGVNEGVTERFAKMVAGDPHLIDLPPVYTAEVRVADALLARVGPDRLSQAYFKGEVSQLRAFLDSDLGPGTFNRFSRAAQRNDLDGALQVLMGR